MKRSLIEWVTTVALLVTFALLMVPQDVKPQPGAVADTTRGCTSRGFSGTTRACTTNSVAAGSTLVVYVGWTSATVTVTVADDKNGSHTCVQNPTTATGIGRGAMCYFIGTASGNTITTATFSSDPGAQRILVNEYSGVVAPIDKSAGQGQIDPGTGTDAVSSTSITTAINGCFIVGGTTDFAGGNPATGTGFTSVRFNTDARMEHLSQGSAGAQAATFTSPAGTDDFATVVLAICPAASATAARRRIIN